MSFSPAFAVSALFPVLIGPLPAENTVLVAQLCGGGTITIPLEKKGKDTSDCHPKACHAGNCRERSKRGI